MFNVVWGACGQIIGALGCFQCVALLYLHVRMGLV